MEGKSLSNIIRKINALMYNLFNRHTFGMFGHNSLIFSPLKINGKENIYIHQSVTVEYKTWLAAMPLTGNDNCRLEIGEGSSIGHFNHIYATKSVIIGNHVLTADKVYISDNQHGYKDIDVPIKYQSIVQKKTVVIGDGSWIGENVCIMGASIGKHCIIGANSVVTQDIPDYSVAIGSPARVIKKYDTIEKKWIKFN